MTSGLKIFLLVVLIVKAVKAEQIMNGQHSAVLLQGEQTLPHGSCNAARAVPTLDICTKQSLPAKDQLLLSFRVSQLTYMQQNALGNWTGKEFLRLACSGKKFSLLLALTWSWSVRGSSSLLTNEGVKDEWIGDYNVLVGSQRCLKGMDL